MIYQKPQLEECHMNYPETVQGESLPIPDCSLPIKAPAEAALSGISLLLPEEEDI